MGLHEIIKKAKGRSIQRHVTHLKNKGIGDTIRRMDKKEMLELWEWAVTVNDRYEELLSGRHRDVRDSKELPFSKEEIKLAIKLLLLVHLAAGKEEVVRNLKDRYVGLAHFQAIPEEAMQMLVTDAGNHIDKSNRFTNYSTYNTLVETVVAEKKQLLDQINVFLQTPRAVKEGADNGKTTGSD